MSDPDCLIYDCHVHPWRPLERTVAAARSAGVHRLNLFSAGYPPGERPGSANPFSPPPDVVERANDVVLQWIEQMPEVISGFCFLNPDHPGHCAEEVERCIGRGPMVGIKLWIARRASEEPVFEVARLAERYGVPLLVHCWNKATGNIATESDTRDVAILAAAFPKLPIIAAHLTGQAEQGVLDLEPHPNVFVDTSGGDAEAGILEFALRRLGAERILFSSDFPARDFGSALGRVEAAVCDPAARRAILGENFRKLLEKGKSF